MDKCDEELFDLKQKIVDLVKENNEMKELILFLDDERNYARQFVKDFNAKQSMNWNSLKQKLNYLEQKQFELIKENYSLKQLCVLLDENNAAATNNSNSNLVSHPQPPTSLSSSSSSSSATTSPPSSSTIILNKSSSIICQYIINLENELKNRGYTMNRPKYVQNLLKLNSLREDPSINGIISKNNKNAEMNCCKNGSLSLSASKEKSIIDSLSETAIKSIFNLKDI